MKFAVATSLLFATLALANPAPVAQPEALQASPEQPRYPIGGAILAPELSGRSSSSSKSSRSPKKSKPKPSKPKNSNETNSTEEDTSAAPSVVLPNLALELGALSVGVIELVRLWG
ncbi:unnamed protein product [Periconia digitata]|uniref:Uncharacterized protein n=1 Tax=Periconia digitata TaxID=1303443 RepID=A0A9W4UI32_9PLEO|nr:unnamed protein product [Periconia digitata]